MRSISLNLNEISFMRKLDINEKVTVLIPANGDPFGSGIFLETGSTYTITVKNKSLVWYDGYAQKPHDAEGKNHPLLLLFQWLMLMPSAKYFSLIGSINYSRHSFFKIGYGKTYTPPCSGEFICFPNKLHLLNKASTKGHQELIIEKVACHNN